MENHLPYPSERREKTIPGHGESPLAAVPPAGEPVRTAPLAEGSGVCADHPAVIAFQALYSGKQRRDAKAWLDYFTSPDCRSIGSGGLPSCCSPAPRAVNSRRLGRC